MVVPNKEATKCLEPAILILKMQGYHVTGPIMLPMCCNYLVRGLTINLSACHQVGLYDIEATTMNISVQNRGMYEVPLDDLPVRFIQLIGSYYGERSINYDPY